MRTFSTVRDIERELKRASAPERETLREKLSRVGRANFLWSLHRGDGPLTYSYGLDFQEVPGIPTAEMRKALSLPPLPSPKIPKASMG